jgi:hypothetical protein
MIKNNLQYKVTKRQQGAIINAIEEYEKKVEEDKNNLKLTTQLDVFKGQLSEVNQELEAYEHRMEFRKYAKEGNDEKVAEMSFENPLLKKYLNREQLIRFSDYYEDGIKKIILGQLDNSNKIIKDLTAKLKETERDIKSRGF